MYSAVGRTFQLLEAKRTQRYNYLWHWDRHACFNTERILNNFFWQYMTEDFKRNFQRQGILCYKNIWRLKVFFFQNPPNDFKSMSILCLNISLKAQERKIFPYSSKYKLHDRLQGGGGKRNIFEQFLFLRWKDIIFSFKIALFMAKNFQSKRFFSFYEFGKRSLTPNYINSQLKYVNYYYTPSSTVGCV